jgi:hypothetical protein
MTAAWLYICFIYGLFTYAFCFRDYERRITAWLAHNLVLRFSGFRLWILLFHKIWRRAVWWNVTWNFSDEPDISTFYFKHDGTNWHCSTTLHGVKWKKTAIFVTNKELERLWKETVRAWFEILSRNLLGVNVECYEMLKHGIQCHSRDLNSEPSENEAAVLTIWLHILIQARVKKLLGGYKLINITKMNLIVWMWSKASNMAQVSMLMNFRVSEEIRNIRSSWATNSLSRNVQPNVAV